jgi:hypothetical protein
MENVSYCADDGRVLVQRGEDGVVTAPQARESEMRDDPRVEIREHSLPVQVGE